MFDKSIAQLMHHSVKCLDADQAQGFVGPDMGPNRGLKRISADGPCSFHSTGMDQLSCSRAPIAWIRPDVLSALIWFQNV